MIELSTISGLITAVFVLGVLIFVHELGHFLVAKKLNFCILKFSIGFGKKLFGFVRGETEYILSAIPLGGYVKFYGENAMGEEEDVDVLSEEEKSRAGDVPEERQFANIHPFKRILTVLAGPIANIIFASFLFTVILLIGFAVPNTKIGETLEDHPAYAAGVRTGDVILEIDGRKAEDWEDVRNFIARGKGDKVKLKIDRNGETLDFVITPNVETFKDPLGDEHKKRLVGIIYSDEPEDMRYKRLGLGKAIYGGGRLTVDYMYVTVKGIMMLISGELPIRKNLGGPIMIVQMTGEFAQKGFTDLLRFMAVISISLGIINLMPIPILDGGALVFFFVELIKGSPLGIKKRMVAQQIGMFLLVALMLFAIYNDIARIVSPDEADKEKTTIQQTR
jgi:regulator of sigma E protease